MKKILCIFSFLFATFFGVNTSIFALAYNDPGVNPAFNTAANRWYDKNTGQFVTTPPAGWVPPSTTPSTTPKPTTTTGTTPKPTATAGAAAPKPTVKGQWKSMSRVGKVGTVFGLIGGPFMVYESTKGQTEHSGWNVAGGVAGGAMGGAAVGSVVPAIGTAIGAAVGAVVGGLVSGSQLFSETDCMTDPVTGQYTCCNTAFNKGERQVDIGGYMFCNATDAAGRPLTDDQGRPVAIKGSVRQCQVGGKGEKSGWWQDLWQDDAWSSSCMLRLCSDEKKTPTPAIDAPDVNWIEDTKNFCWRWEYDTDNGGDGSGVIADNPYDTAIQKIQSLQQDIITKCGNIF